MELRYTFDPKRFRLGKLCIHGHVWPGTNQSLRRIGLTASNCMGCTGRKQSYWLLSFLDYKTMGWPKGQTLGKLCPRQHRWNNWEASLRVQGKCIECETIRRNAASTRQRRKEWYQENIDEQRRKAGERMRLACLDPSKREKIKEQARESRRRTRPRLREELRKQGLTSRGTVPKNASGARPRGSPEDQSLRKAIRNAGKLPTVVQLVYQQQRDYWRDHPDDKRKHDNERKRQYGRWRHMTDESYRLYHRQKSKRRKALERGSIGIHVTGKQLQARYAQFDHRCAYCGATGDLHMDHLVPIAKGGTHCLGNLIPACTACNFSKTTHEAEAWYRSQPFFSEVRWRKIRRALGMSRGPATQLALM